MTRRGAAVRDPAPTLSLGREDDHFLFVSMARYQFNGLLEEEKPDGRGSAEKGTTRLAPCFWFYRKPWSLYRLT